MGFSHQSPESQGKFGVRCFSNSLETSKRKTEFKLEEGIKSTDDNIQDAQRKFDQSALYNRDLKMQSPLPIGVNPKGSFKNLKKLPKVKQSQEAFLNLIKE